MRFSVLVEVRLRPGVADPQGATIERALPALGFDAVQRRDGRQGHPVRRSTPPTSGRARRGRRPVRALPHQPGDRGRDVRRAVGQPERMTVGVVLFPGTNCELDVVEAVARARRRGRDRVARRRQLGASSTRSCCPAASPTATTCAPGAIARFSPVMDAVAAFAADGGPVVGICNGFQVLTEAGLLPGALQKNAGLKFLCTAGSVRVETDRTRCSRPRHRSGEVLRDPDQPLRGQLHVLTRDARRAASRRPGRVPLRRQPQRRRSTTSPACATRAATSSGSCPTPSGRATRCSARPTARSLLRSLLVDRPPRRAGSTGVS